MILFQFLTFINISRTQAHNGIEYYKIQIDKIQSQRLININPQLKSRSPQQSPMADDSDNLLNLQPIRMLQLFPVRKISCLQFDLQKYKKLFQVLNCSFCKQIFNTPTYLKCSHRFCKDCIEKHIRKNDKKSCPICRGQLATKRDTKSDLKLISLISFAFGDASTLQEEINKCEEQAVKKLKFVKTKTGVQMEYKRQRSQTQQSKLKALQPTPRKRSRKQQTQDENSQKIEQKKQRNEQLAPIPIQKVQTGEPELRINSQIPRQYPSLVYPSFSSFNPYQFSLPPPVMQGNMNMIPQLNPATPIYNVFNTLYDPYKGRKKEIEEKNFDKQRENQRQKGKNSQFKVQPAWMRTSSKTRGKNGFNEGNPTINNSTNINIISTNSNLTAPSIKGKARNNKKEATVIQILSQNSNQPQTKTIPSNPDPKHPQILQQKLLPPQQNVPKICPQSSKPEAQTTIVSNPQTILATSIGSSQPLKVLPPAHLASAHSLLHQVLPSFSYMDTLIRLSDYVCQIELNLRPLPAQFMHQAFGNGTQNRFSFMLVPKLKHQYCLITADVTIQQLGTYVVGKIGGVWGSWRRLVRFFVQTQIDKIDQVEGNEVNLLDIIKNYWKDYSGLSVYIKKQYITKTQNRIITKSLSQKPTQKKPIKILYYSINSKQVVDIRKGSKK